MLNTYNTIIMITKPILKWVGGKTQIINTLIENFPKEIENYHEVFLGGGSVLLAILSYIKDGDIKLNGKIYAYDYNEKLIQVYKDIQSNKEELFKDIQCYINKLNTLTCTKKHKRGFVHSSIDDIKSKESYYYFIRDKYNKLEDKLTIDGSAMFIFLNKTCFRGVYREGPNGFNVPYGNYPNPSIITKTHLDEVSELIKNVKFIACDFSKSLKKVKKGDFVYMDPPYAPENSKSFVSYTKDGFDLEQHTKLFKLCNDLSDNLSEDKKFLMSNSNVELVKESFKQFHIEEITCKRSINSKNPGSKAKEVLIKNY